MSPLQPTWQVLLLVLLLGRPAWAASSGDAWVSPDKAKHFGVTLGLAGLGYGGGALLFETPRARLLSGAGLAMGVGLGKELYDLGRGGRFSGKDLVWDALGTATGLALSWLVERLFFSEAPARPAARPAAEETGALMDAGSATRRSDAAWNALCCQTVTVRLP
jgi:putative lipoprotein